ncbi:hypothetical protein EYR36_003454 [Pleurotus pulmonarius]|nr:hypothetical protein EYR36_003454 [Pleurotus pulmonarius]
MPLPEQDTHTPRIWHHSLCSTYMTSNFATQRQLVVQDHPEIPVVSLEFFQSVTPVVPDDMLNAVLYKLEEDGWTTGMRGFAENHPKDSGRPENDTFTHIHNFTAAIIRSGEDHTGQKSCMTIGHSPNSTPLSERGNSSRPDGFGRSVMAQDIDEVAETKLPKPVPSWSGIILAKEDMKGEKASDTLDVSTPSHLHSLQAKPRGRTLQRFCGVGITFFEMTREGSFALG